MTLREDARHLLSNNAEDFDHEPSLLLMSFISLALFTLLILGLALIEAVA